MFVRSQPMGVCSVLTQLMFDEMSPFQIKIRRKKKKEKNTPVIALYLQVGSGCLISFCSESNMVL
jgi:hypothetical protein